VTAPAVVKEVKPVYPPEAMTVVIEGSVILECTVNTDGTPADVTVLRPLYPLLDRAAAAALQQWRFTPGVKAGAAVPVRVEIEMTFTLARRSPALDSPSVSKPGSGVTLPRVLSEVKPEYPVRLREAGVRGLVEMDCVVLPDGTVGDVRVTRWIDPDLDVAAVQALRQWRFAPGAREGKPVPVQVFVQMTFSTR
jgi:TonB family protein